MSLKRAVRGKKTALLQALVVCRLVRFANVLFSALAVPIFLSFCSKINAVVGFSSLAPNVLVFYTQFAQNS